MAQKKEQIKIPEKELSNEEIDNLSDAEFKTVVIRMLTEMIEYSCKIKEEVKAIQSEIKKNEQGTNSESKELGLKSTIWKRTKKLTFNWNRMKKQKFKKMRKGLGIPGTTLNIPISES